MRFACNTCPYVHNITRKVGSDTLSRSVFSNKVVFQICDTVYATDLEDPDLFVCFLQVNNRKYPKLKEVDDVLGGAAAWENVDSTAGK